MKATVINILIQAATGLIGSILSTTVLQKTILLFGKKLVKKTKNKLDDKWLAILEESWTKHENDK